MRIDWKYFNNNEEVVKGIDLVRQINELGYDAYIVGGCVRDIVRWYTNKTGDPNIHDVDICTNMPMDKLYKTFKCESNNGEEHGTILVFNKGEAFEVTQFRADGDYSDGRHPDSVKWADTFEEDSKRRDFTINAMAIDADGNLIDYHGGAEDLANGILRTVGDPDERFGEDALRIIRAMRFAARFNMKLDHGVYNSICKLHGTLNKVAMERISAELKKTAEYGVKAFAQVMDIMVKTGAYHSFDPQKLLDWNSALIMAQNRAVSQKYIELNKDVMTSMICLLYNCKNLQHACQYFRLENDLMKTAYYVFTNLPIYKTFGTDIVATVKMINNPNYCRLEEVAHALSYKEPNAKISQDMEYVSDIAIPLSKDLSKAVSEKGYSGPAFGKKLKELTEWFYNQILDTGEAPSYEEILNNL